MIYLSCAQHQDAVRDYLRPDTLLHRAPQEPRAEGDTQQRVITPGFEQPIDKRFTIGILGAQTIFEREKVLHSRLR